MSVTELNKVQYVDADFLTAVTNIKNFLNDNYPDEYNDYVNANLGQALIDIIAYAEQNLMWNLNRKVTDLYFPTAITPNSVAKIARMLGYKSKGAAGAVVSITVTLTKGPYSFPVSINKGFQFRAKNNSLWEYRGDVAIVFVPGETQKTFEVVQGYSVTNTFVSNGQTNQVFKLLTVPSGKYVDVTSLLVTVAGVEWTEYPVIPFETVAAYESNLVSFPPQVKFGDGVQGNIPSQGSGIQIAYLVTDGFRGRITSNSINQPVVGLIAQFQSIPISIAQPEGSAGGEDPEDVRSIVVNAPLFQSTQDRAITKPDYDFLSNQYPNVAKADAQVIRGVSGDVTLMFYLDSIVSSVSGAIADFGAKTVSSFDLMYQDLLMVSGASLAFEAGVSSQSAIIISNTLLHFGQIESGTNATLDTFASGIEVYFDSIDADTYAIDQYMVCGVSDVDTLISIKQANINSLLTQINNAVSGASVPIKSDVASLITATQGKLTELRSAVYAYDSTLQSNVQSKTAHIRSQTGLARTDVTAVSGDIDSAVSGYQALVISDINSLNALMVSGVSAWNQAAVSGFSSMMLHFDSVIQQVEAVADLPAVVTAYVEGLSGYLDVAVADSCRANIVQVAVLAKDSSRRYVAPPQSLLDGLKVLLDERKDVTHYVSTVAGLSLVVDADVIVEAKVSKNAVEDVVINNIQNALIKSDVEPLGILVEREFGKSLYLSELYNAIKDAVGETDLDHVNVQIVGPTKFLDAYGNLVIPAGYVIQAGTVQVISLPRY